MPRRRAFQKTVQHLNLTNRQRVKWQANYYIARRQARSFKTAYNAIPFPVALSLRAGFIALLLLYVMPLHPIAIPASLGGGVSIALIISFFRI